MGGDNKCKKITKYNILFACHGSLFFFVLELFIPLSLLVFHMSWQFFLSLGKYTEISSADISTFTYKSFFITLNISSRMTISLVA